ncbi:MAG: M1 family metallopeptidase [Solirubrobacterales bacterium]
MAKSRSHTSLVVLGISVGALMIGALMVGQAQAQGGGSGGCLPGAAGIGDEYYPTYGNGGYDVRHYDLDVAYDPATDLIDGEAGIDAKAIQRLCSFNLDLVGLDVRRVKVDDRRATWTRDGQELVITPKRSLDKGPFDVEVRYDGLPSEFTIPGTTIRTGFMATPEGATVAGQPEVAAGWFPVNDHPSDKASYAFDVRVPDEFEVVANGFLRDRDRHKGKGETTWEWKAREPMASYLATIDIADWDVDRSRTDYGLQYDAVDTNITGGLRAEIDSSLARQGEILDLLSESFGPYPFNTLGAIVPNQDDLRFALETQTRSVYSKLFWLDSQGNPENGDFVVVHELAHQWFGDDVALARWQDIWLNEGFASYAEWMWEEYEGRGTPQELFQATYDAIPADDPFWSIPIGDPGVEDLFSDPVYVRGAMTVQALRNEVGDQQFFRILRRWTADHSGGHGTTPQFIALAERVAGRQLDDLFDTWLFTGEKPPPEAVEAGVSRSKQSLSAGERSRATGWLDDARARLGDGSY